MPQNPNATSPAASPQKFNNDSTSSSTSTSASTRSPLRTLVVMLAIGLIVGVQLFGHRLGPLYASLVTELSSSSSSSSSLEEQQEEVKAQQQLEEASENQRLEGFLHNKISNNDTNIKKKIHVVDSNDKRTTAAETGEAENLSSDNKGQSSPADEEAKMEHDDKASNSASASANTNKKPLNVIIFYPDDWRHDDIGGVAPVVRTPFLNELAQQGIRFTHNAVTTSICWISRATLFTGQYASRHKSLRLRQPLFYDDWYNTSWPALLQRFKSYWVGHVGKWQFVNRGGIVQKSLFNWTNLHEGAHWYEGQPAANYSRDAALQFLRERPRHHGDNEEPTPFALTVAFYPPKAVTLNPAPGAQWTPSRHFYENDTIPNPPYNITESYLKLPWFFHTDEKYGRDWWTKRFQTTEQYQRGMKNYYSLITEVDQACREIVDELKSQQILEDTLLIFTTDNGLFHSEHGLAGKWYPYQESIRVPLIVRDPRMHATHVNTMNGAHTLNVDLASTILGAAGIAVPNQMQGRDLADLYTTPRQQEPPEQEQQQLLQQQLANATDSLSRQGPWRAEFYYEFPLDKGKGMPMSSAVVRRDMKYIWWPQYAFQQLFNLTEDPLEQNDIINQTQYATLIQELEQRRVLLQQAVA